MAVVVSVPLAVEAGAQPTYQSLWDGVAGKCRKETHPDLILFYCDNPTVIWYFTQPGTPAHPGVIERKIVQRASGDFYAVEHGRSFGPESAQAPFKALMASIKALDKAMADDMRRGNQ